eukprot:TRINITY_DN2785_c0_g2_i1.p1 TRINITY_DN2785_c0_g2~~TRINITY_DN2785_c0_g2_i1.p1  ORF type:complete len:433 (+),score=157.02 TRINITY_DN2785_c0_g2_i1:66-1301(+)
MAHDVELTADERQRALAAHTKVMGDRWWVMTSLELRNICAEIGLQPSLEEMENAIADARGELDFAGVLAFVQRRKADYYAAEPGDADTIRAFVAVGGCGDKSGGVVCERLRQTCARFSLTVDLDGIFRGIEAEGKAMEFQEFQSMLDDRGRAAETDEAESFEDPAEQSPSRRAHLGLDFQTLLQRERAGREEPQRAARQPPPSPAARSRSPPQAPRPHGELPPLDECADPQRNMRLRQKGIDPVLWGGEAADVAVVEPQSPGNAARQRRLRQPRGHGRAGKGGKNSRWVSTHTIGRGLLVDDPAQLPRHYPQQQQQQQALQLPPLTPSPRGGRSPQRQAARAATAAGSPDRPALAAIERRMHEIGRRRLGAKYLKVAPRVNTTGSPFTELVQSPPPPGAQGTHRALASSAD